MIEALILSRFGNDYITMFLIMGSGSVLSLLLLLLVFEQSRFEPDWAKIFTREKISALQQQE